MKKFLVVALVFICAVACAQSPSYTPNLGLQIPGYGTTNWQIPMNYNFNLLDGILGGTNSLSITTWNPAISYSVNNLVIYQGKGYESLGNSNLGNIPTNTTYWTNQLTGSSGGSWATLPGGTNNSGTFYCGAGCTIQAIGGGVVNANIVSGVSYANGGTWVQGGIAYVVNPNSIGTTSTMIQYGVMYGGGYGSAPSSTAADSTATDVLCAGSPPAFCPITAGMLPSTINSNTTGQAEGLSGASRLPNGSLATTQAPGTSGDLVATVDYVLAAAAGGGGIFTHTLSGASVTAVVNSSLQAATDINYLTMSANVTNFALPASTGIYDGESINITIAQPASGGPYTLPSGSASSPLTPGSGTSIVDTIPGGCPTIGTTVSGSAPSQLIISLTYRASLTQYQILACTTSSPSQSGVVEATIPAFGQFGALPANTQIAFATPFNKGHFFNLSVANATGGTCATAPTFNVFDGTTGLGTTLTASTTVQTPGNAIQVGQTLSFNPGDIIGVKMTSAGSCTVPYFVVSAQYVEP